MRKLVTIFTILGMFLSVLTAQQPAPTAASENERGEELMRDQKYSEAIELYKKFTELYKADALLDSARLNLGIAYLFTQKFDLAVEQFKLCYESRLAIAELKDAALFWMGSSQFYKAISLRSVPKSEESSWRPTMLLAIETLTKHLGEFPESMYREEAYFRRAQCNFFIDNFVAVYADVELLRKEFLSSTSMGDYLMLKAKAESTEVWRALNTDKKERAEVLKLSEKPFQTLRAIIESSSSPVIVNEARLQMGELQKLLAEEPEEYQKAIELYRQVKTKQELIPKQEVRLKEISEQMAEAGKQRNRRRIDQLRMIHEKERSRLQDLKQSDDPMLEAMMQIASCYIPLRKPNEARVLLRRLSQFVPEAQKKQVSYMTILTYAMQSERNADAKKAFEAHQAAFPNDDQADNISIMIADELARQGNYERALEQYQKSLADYPKGRHAERAAMEIAVAQVQLNKPEEAVKTLQSFVEKNPLSPLVPKALFNLGQAQIKMGNIDEALKTFKALRENPAAGAFGPNVILIGSKALMDAKRVDEAIEQLRFFVEKYPDHEQASGVMLSIAASLRQKNDIEGSIKTLNDLLAKYGTSARAPDAASFLAQNYQALKKVPEMIAAFERVIKDFPQSLKNVGAAHSALAKHYEKNREFEKAEAHYKALIELKQPDTAPWGYFNLASMRFNAANSLGAYTALNEEEKKQWNAHIASAEKTCIELLKQWPDSKESGLALQSLVKLAIDKAKFKIFTEEQAEKYFLELAKTFENPDLKVRIELASAGIPYEKGDHPRALKMFKSILEANPTARMTADDMNRYGTALFINKEYDESIAIYKKMEEMYPNDPFAMANATYGLGAAYLRKGDLAKMSEYFEILKSKYGWSPKIMEAEFGIGLAAEEAKKYEEALQSYTNVVRGDKSTPETKAKATLGRGRIFQAKGQKIPDLKDKNQPSALAEYMRVIDFFENEKAMVQEATKAILQLIDEVGLQELIATQAPLTLYSVGELYDKSGRKTEAVTLYEAFLAKDSKSPRASKATERLKNLK